MKIAFLIPSLANQGPVLVAKDLVDQLVVKGHQCIVYYFDAIEEVNFPCTTQQITFFQKLPFQDYDVIHSHMFRPDLYCAYHVVFGGLNVKTISTIHTAIDDDLKNAYGYLKSKLLPPLWKWSWSKMTHVVVLTEQAKKYYSTLATKNEILVINNGRDLPAEYDSIPTEDLAIINQLKKDYILLGTVASFDKRKGLEQIVELLSLHEKYAFLVIGHGIERQPLEELAAKLGVSHRFRILGARPQGFRYIPHFNIFVIPSRSEGLPLALLEAAAQHVPVVCSRIPVFEEIFDSTQISFFELDNIPELTLACENANLNGFIYSANAYKKYMENYTANKMCDNYLTVYGAN